MVGRRSQILVVELRSFCTPSATSTWTTALALIPLPRPHSFNYRARTHSTIITARCRPTFQALYTFRDKHPDYRARDVELALVTGTEWVRRKQRADGSWYYTIFYYYNSALPTYPRGRLVVRLDYSSKPTAAPAATLQQSKEIGESRYICCVHLPTFTCKKTLPYTVLGTARDTPPAFTYPQAAATF